MPIWSKLCRTRHLSGDFGLFRTYISVCPAPFRNTVFLPRAPQNVFHCCFCCRCCHICLCVRRRSPVSSLFSLSSATLPTKISLFPGGDDCLSLLTPHVLHLCPRIRGRPCSTAVRRRFGIGLVSAM